MTYDYTWVYGAAMILSAVVTLITLHIHLNRKK